MEDGPFWIIITGLLTYAGGLFSTYFAQWLQSSKDKETRLDERELHAQYLAIRVVCKLDPFVNRCCDVVEDDGEEDQEGETHARIEEPDLTFPDDVDWKSIPPELMYRIIGFPNELENAQKYIHWVASELAFAPDYDEIFEARKTQYGQLGLTALSLADDLREKYKIPKQELGGRDSKDILEKALAKAKKEREANLVSQNELMEEI